MQMQQCLSAKHREQMRMVSQKSEENLEGAMQQRQMWRWIQQREVPGLLAFTVYLFRIRCGPIPSQSMGCSGWANYVQVLAHRRNPAEWQRMSRRWLHQWRTECWVWWLRWQRCSMNHPGGGAQVEGLCRFQECLLTYFESMKQWLEPESTRAETGGIARDIMVIEGIREFGSERVDTLSLNSLGAQSESMQPPDCVELWELLIIFLTPQWWKSRPWLL